MNKTVIVITINYNQNQYTLNCIESLLKSDYDHFQIMLIDNGSTKTNKEELERLLPDDNRVILKKIINNRGYVAGINYGLEECSKLNPDYYVIMNNDTIIERTAISELVKTAEKYNNRAIVAGKVLHMDHPDYIQQTGTIFTDRRYLHGYSPGKNELDTGQCDIEEERDSLDDILWILPASIIKDIGNYCNYFFLYAEQGDFAQRARRFGYKLIYTPKVKIWHKGSITSGGGNKQALPVCYWTSKSGVIFSYRNLKFKYFLIRNLNQILKLLAKSIILKGVEKKRSIARLRGVLAGLKWFFNKKPDNGYNPYIKEI